MKMYFLEPPSFQAFRSLDSVTFNPETVPYKFEVVLALRQSTLSAPVSHCSLSGWETRNAFHTSQSLQINADVIAAFSVSGFQLCVALF